MVKYAFTVPPFGMVFKIVPAPGCTVHDLLEPDVKVFRVQHLIDMVEYKEHQLAFRLHRSAVFVQGVGIVPILEQFQEVRPLVNTMDPHVGLVVLAAGGGPGSSAFVGLFGMFIMKMTQKMILDISDATIICYPPAQVDEEDAGDSTREIPDDDDDDNNDNDVDKVRRLRLPW